MNILAQNLDRLILLSGLSQEAIGEAIGVSQATISRWRSGATVPYRRHLLALATSLGVSVAELEASPSEEEENLGSRIGVRLDGALRLKLEAAAKERGVKPSWIIRQALSEWLNQGPKQTQQSLETVISELTKGMTQLHEALARAGKALPAR